jgi:hypothetical protein
MAEDQVLGAPTMYDRLFKPPPDGTPLDLSNADGIARSRDVFEGNSPGTSVPSPLLSASEQRVVNALVERFAKYARNTNFTAALPAHSAPGYWSNPIDQSAQYTLPAAVGAYVTPTGMSYTAPNGRYGRVEAYGFDVDGSFTYDGSILWRLVLNGSPVQSLLDISNHRGSMVQPSSTFIIVPQGQTLQMQVRRAVAAGGDSLVDMKFKGWDWSLRRNAEGTKSSILAF